MAGESKRREGADDFHTVGDIVHLDKFNVKDGVRDLDVRIVQGSHLLWSVLNVQWVRIRAVEVNGDEEVGPVSLFVVHKDALRREAAEA
ncbi:MULTISPECIES: hypothetical protein [Catenuloplanes]|uniref:Uncharacterized protein n=1 Tax=Catenuloplanes niger TaxID=587534 RepID=A0AAE3ZUL0_9ACTN|nr:hypothetical protein [Catenuloplanes niger]MDR7324165.1 hypothetical protein [Catenuloplanes niger]